MATHLQLFQPTVPTLLSQHQLFSVLSPLCSFSPPHSYVYLIFFSSHSPRETEASVSPWKSCMQSSYRALDRGDPEGGPGLCSSKDFLGNPAELSCPNLLPPTPCEVSLQAGLQMCLLARIPNNHQLSEGLRSGSQNIP